MRPSFRTLFALAAFSLLCACGGIATDPLSSGHSPPVDAVPDGSAIPPPAEPDASSPPLHASTDAAPDVTQTADAAPSACEAAGGTCLELVPCEGVQVALACGWSAACCIPSSGDASACPVSVPQGDTPCDAPPSLACEYPACTTATCRGGLWSLLLCSPPPKP